MYIIKTKINYGLQIRSDYEETTRVSLFIKQKYSYLQRKCINICNDKKAFFLFNDTNKGKERIVLFNDTLNTFYLWLYGTVHTVKRERKPAATTIWASFC